MEHIKLILASQSPRRRELIKGLDIPVETAENYDFDESYPSALPLDEVAVYLSEKKSDAYPLNLKNNEILVTADTLVKHNDKLLGKPLNDSEAKEMLRELSGDMHEVITGVCLRTNTGKRVFGEKSLVFFNNLTSEDIDYYVEKYKPSDKAGAYGIQEWIGYVGIDRIEGSFYNIMGLPTARLRKELNTMYLIKE